MLTFAAVATKFEPTDAYLEWLVVGLPAVASCLGVVISLLALELPPPVEVAACWVFIAGLGLLGCMP
jgi:hypothetical protein